MKIIQITGTDKIVLGLGDDGRVYYWQHSKGQWAPFTSSGENNEMAVFIPE